jgi:DNA polymerase (family 10)
MVTVITESAYPMALIEATGPEEFVAAIRERSVGIYMRHATDEESLFTALSLPFIPPELRDLYVGETARPFHEPIPSLVTEADLTGLFHCHTTWSDGAESIDTMAAACIERGYRYLGISDHSVSAHYAGGLTADDLKRQREEIDKVNESRAYFTLYHGVESDIRADGSLDYTDADLEKLDFVIASVHSGWGGKSMEEMTARLIRAIEHPATTMLGHMTGRLLLTREGYQVDVDAIIDACARTGVIIELNANPHRLDIDWHHIPKALAAGVKIAINPDAHRIAGLDHTAYGVALARKGGVTAGDVFNTLPAQQIGEALQSVRK